MNTLIDKALDYFHLSVLDLTGTTYPDVRNQIKSELLKAIMQCKAGSVDQWGKNIKQLFGEEE